MIYFSNFANYCMDNKGKLFIFLVIFHALNTLILDSIVNSNFAYSLHDKYDGFWNFAMDSWLYHNEAIEGQRYLENSLWLNWLLMYPEHLHVKIISFLYWITGNSSPVIYQMIVGSLIWTASVLIVYISSIELFPNSNKVPLITSLFFFQPSFFMHSTQLLRDPFFTLGVCIFIYGSILVYKSRINLKSIVIINIGILLMIAMRSYLVPVILIFLILFSALLLLNKRASYLGLFLILMPLTLVQNFSTNKYFSLQDLAVDANSVWYQLPDLDEYQDRLEGRENTADLRFEEELDAKNLVEKKAALAVIEEQLYAQKLAEEQEALEILNVQKALINAQKLAEETEALEILNTLKLAEEQEALEILNVQKALINTLKLAEEPEALEILNTLKLAEEPEALEILNTLKLAEEPEALEILITQKPAMKASKIAINAQKLVEDQAAFKILQAKIKSQFEAKNASAKIMAEIKVEMAHQARLDKLEAEFDAKQKIKNEALRIKYEQKKIKEREANKRYRDDFDEELYEEKIQRVNKVNLAFFASIRDDPESSSYLVSIIKSLDRIAAQFSALRLGFHNYGMNIEGGSYIDINQDYVDFDSLINYFPRAVTLGFLSPFPSDMFKTGYETGRIGRLIAGLETLVFYAICFGALYALYRSRSQLAPLSISLLFSIMLIILLAYVVPNIGSLYRMRQPYLIPFYIAGVHGWYLILNLFNKKFE